IGGSLLQLGGHVAADAAGQRIPERPLHLRGERRVVELVVRHQAEVVLAAAAAGPDDAVHGRVLRPVQPLHAAELRQPHGDAALASGARAVEAVGRAERVVHVTMVFPVTALAYSRAGGGTQSKAVVRYA